MVEPRSALSKATGEHYFASVRIETDDYILCISSNCGSDGLESLEDTKAYEKKLYVEIHSKKDRNVSTLFAITNRNLEGILLLMDVMAEPEVSELKTVMRTMVKFFKEPLPKEEDKDASSDGN